MTKMDDLIGENSFFRADDPRKLRQDLGRVFSVQEANTFMYRTLQRIATLDPEQSVQAIAMAKHAMDQIGPNAIQE